MNQEKIGIFIKKLRKKNNLTQQQFAEKLGVTYQAVSKWENGKNIPDIAILKQISEIFQIDLNSLLNGEIILEKKNKKNLAIISVILLVVLVIIFIFISINKSNDYSFKTIFSNCEDFKIFGSVAYNKEKSTIYISKIEYCGQNDNTRYKKIDSILYESINNIDKKINEHIQKDDENKTLEEYLYDLSFYIDNYNSSCKNFSQSKIYLQLNATTEENKVINYKIPLKLEEKCSSN